MYEIILHQDVIKKDLLKLSATIKKRIKQAIRERLTTDPVSFGKPLQYSLKGHRRLRVSDYRVVYRIAARKKTVYIVAIKHRKDIYD